MPNQIQRITSQLMPVRPDNAAVDKVDGLETISLTTKTALDNQGDRVIARLVRENSNFKVIAKLHPCPVADFEAAPLTGTEPLSVVFNNNSLYSDSWSWDFGDTESSTDENPTHEYLTGTYSVELTAINMECQDIYSRASYIIVSGGCYWNDTFDSINNSIWDYSNIDALANIDNGRLSVEGAYTYLAMPFLADLLGDFEFSIEYELAGLTEEGDKATFEIDMIGDSFTSYLYHAITIGTYAEYGGLIYSNEEYQNISESVRTGTFKIKRAGNVMTFYINNNQFLTETNDEFLTINSFEIYFYGYSGQHIFVDNLNFISGCPAA